MKEKLANDMRTKTSRMGVERLCALSGGGDSLDLNLGKRCGGAAEVGLSCVGVLGVVV